MPDIFFSYSREDESRIRNLVSVLETHGWSVFWDRRIPAGETWRSYIGSALENARCVVVGWSKHSVDSQWVAEEADEGKSRGVLIPILLDPVKPPPGFREIQAADISAWQPGQSSEGLDGLIAGLQRRLGEQPKVRWEGQPIEWRVAGAESKTAPGSGPFLNLRRFSLAFFLLLIVGAIGYFAVNRLHSNKRPADRARSEEKTALSSQEKTARPSVEEPPPSLGASEHPRTGVSLEGDWLIVTGSFARKDSSEAQKKRSALAQAGIAATVIDTEEYPLLAPNLWAVIVGPFESREKANGALARIRKTVPDAYVKRGR